MSIMHCGKSQKTRFCGSCGERIDGDSPVSELLSYIDKRIEYWANRPEPSGNLEDKGKVAAKYTLEKGRWILWKKCVIEGSEAVRELGKQKVLTQTLDPTWELGKQKVLTQTLDPTMLGSPIGK